MPASSDEVARQDLAPRPVERVGRRLEVDHPRDVAAQALHHQPRLRQDAHGPERQERDQPPAARPHPPGDRDGGERQHHHQLAAREPPALHRQGDEGGDEPAGGEGEGQRRRPRRPPRREGPQGGDQQQPGRLPGGDAEVAVHEEAHQPAAATEVVGVGADHLELAVDEVGPGGVGRRAAVEGLVEDQEGHRRQRQPRAQPEGDPGAAAAPQAPEPDQGEGDGHGRVLHREPRQAHDGERRAPRARRGRSGPVSAATPATVASAPTISG